MWSIARRWSSRCRRRRSSVSTWARSPLAAGAAAPGSVTAVSVAISCITIGPPHPSGGRLLPQAVERLLQGDLLELAPDHHLLKFLQVQDLLLQLRLGLLEVPDHLLVGPHVAEDADGADDLAVGVAEGGGVESGGDDLAAGAAGVQAGVAGDAPGDDLAEGGGELAGLLGTDEAGERLLEQLGWAKPEELGDRVVGLHDFAFEVGNEHRIRSVGDDDVGIQRALPFSTPGVSNDPRLRTEFKPSSHFEPPLTGRRRRGRSILRCHRAMVRLVAITVFQQARSRRDRPVRPPRPANIG